MNTPKIRFKGFTDDWEQRKLNEIADVRDGTHDSPKYVQEGHPFITSKNVSNGFINYDEVQYITDVDYEEINKRSKVDVHDILMGMIGTIGNLALIRQKPDFAIKNVALIKYTGDVDYQYLYQTLQVDCVTRQLFTGMDGGTQKFVSLKKIRELGIPFTEEQEQQKIGQYFENLDNLITLHQRKCDETKQLKKFMLQKMFPKNGEKNPEIRFEGFTDDWEQRKFSELYAKSSEKNDGSIGMDKNITVATMQFKEDVKVSTAEYLKTYYTFNLGDIAFEGHQSKEFRYGRFVENDIGNGIVSHIFAVFRPIREYDLHFWKYAINNEALMQRILSRSTKASTMMHDLVTNDFLNETFLVPSLDEQRRIGVFLDTLDHLITLHQRKCEKLKELKKFMLQNMFV
mgnify:CR=1 FL=1